MKVIGDKLINYENYNDLVIGVIFQACSDYNRVLKAERISICTA